MNKQNRNINDDDGDDTKKRMLKQKHQIDQHSEMFVKKPYFVFAKQDRQSYCPPTPQKV